jgi:hypothetical protein
MAEKDSSNYGFFTIDGYDCLGFSTSIEDGGEVAKTVERTPLGASVERKVVLSQLEPITVRQAGFFDDASDIDLAMSGNRGEEQIVCMAPTGNLLSELFVGVVGGLTVEEKPEARGDLIRTSLAWEAQAYERGFIIAPKLARAAAGNTQATPHVDPAATTDGAVCYLAMTALTLGGYTNVTVKVRHSPDGAVWADLATFTARTLRGAQRLVVAGNVDEQLALSWAYGGAGAGPSWTGLVGVKRL